MPSASPVPAASPWIARFGPFAPAGPVLDVAAGHGRHTRFFLAHGRRVTAVDRDLSGLSDLEETPELELMQADLEDGTPWPLPRRQFAAVIVTNYLYRPLFPVLAAAVAPGGLLLYETFAEGHGALGRPSNPDFLLRPGELLSAFGGTLGILAYEHGLTLAPAVVQRIAAVNGNPADTPLP